MFGTPTRQVSKVMTRPAPTKGLNSHDAIVAMPDGFALILRNLYAQPYGCQVRRGYRKHVTDLNGAVETLASHNLSNAELYAFVSDAPGIATLYNVTEPMVPGVQEITGLLNARWEHVNFPNAAGVHMVAVNGADNLLWFKSDSTIVQVTAGSGAGDTIGGVDPKVFIDVYTHQKRLWFVEKNSTRGWYMPTEQITGVANSFEFGTNWTRGGSLNQIITWTIDDGNGADDHLAAISTEGEVSVYAGLDVEGADTWALVGVYYAGAPVGQRSAIRYGGDILMVTQYGLVFLSDLLKSTKVNPTQENIAKYIQQLLSNSVTLTGSRFGWQPFLFPAANMLMINIPATDTTAYQFVMNDITKAWSQFLGYNANCWELHNELPFFGSFGAVYRAWEGYTDNSSIDPDTGVVTLGTVINAEAQTAFSYFDALAVNKHFKMVRPTIVSAGEFAISFSVNADFNFNSPLAPSTFVSNIDGIWDVDYWDNATWSGGLDTFKNWQSVTGIGTAGALRLLIRSSSETYWAATDWVYELGSVM
jgi:hypothetical protein